MNRGLRSAVEVKEEVKEEVCDVEKVESTWGMEKAMVEVEVRDQALRDANLETPPSRSQCNKNFLEQGAGASTYLN